MARPKAKSVFAEARWLYTLSRPRRPDSSEQFGALRAKRSRPSDKSGTQTKEIVILMQRGSAYSHSSRTGFTIIEILAVIAIIALLSAIVFGLARGATERAKISQARAELALLAQHLEEFRSHYGDYPRIETSESNSPNENTATQRAGEQGAIRFLDALNGMRPVRARDARFSSENRQRSFIDRDRFWFEFSPTLQPPAAGSDSETAEGALIDPWGNLYRYFYEPDDPPPAAGNRPTWRNPRFVIYSKGPDGEHEPPGQDGFLDRNHPTNIDNVFAEER